MLLQMMRAKLHRVTVTEADLTYEGSLTVDKVLLDKAGMFANEMVQVFNVNTGDRFQTYLLPGPADSGVICLNGAAARKGQKGDILILVTTCWLEKDEAAKHQPQVVLVDAKNRPRSA